MGPLFICSAYSDKVLYETTKKILKQIEKKFKDIKIKFYISKLLENMDKYDVLIID
jgi:DNA replication protein DnaC